MLSTTAKTIITRTPKSMSQVRFSSTAIKIISDAEQQKKAMDAAFAKIRAQQKQMALVNKRLEDFDKQAASVVKLATVAPVKTITEAEKVHATFGSGFAQEVLDNIPDTPEKAGKAAAQMMLALLALIITGVLGIDEAKEKLQKFLDGERAQLKKDTAEWEAEVGKLEIAVEVKEKILAAQKKENASYLAWMADQWNGVSAGLDLDLATLHETIETYQAKIETAKLRLEQMDEARAKAFVQMVNEFEVD